MQHEEAMSQGIAYAYGREDVSKVATRNTERDPSGPFAFASAYAQGWEEFNAGQRGSMTTLREAYDRWQASTANSHDYLRKCCAGCDALANRRMLASAGQPSIWGPHDQLAKSPV